jgi:hypothetical protein
MTNDELRDYYISLLIMQYYDKPKARAFVSAFITELVANQIIFQVRDGFDVDTAVGKQLDTLGEYRGAKRDLAGLNLARTFFRLYIIGETPSVTTDGFMIYGDTDPKAFFHRYNDDKTIYTLNDNDLRNLIKLRILQHKSNHSVKDIDDILFSFFGMDCNMTDGLDMTMTYTFSAVGPDDFAHISAFTNSLPKPSGVSIQVLYI